MHRDPAGPWRPWSAAAGWWRANSLKARIGMVAGLVVFAFIVIALVSPSSSDDGSNTEAGGSPSAKRAAQASKQASAAAVAARQAKARAAVRAEARADRIRRAKAAQARRARAARRKAAAVRAARRRAAAAARAARRQAAAVQAAKAAQARNCNPNYSGCLDPNAYDYDCEGGSGDGPSYTGLVEVIGSDEYRLDADGDGIGCEDD